MKIYLFADPGISPKWQERQQGVPAVLEKIGEGTDTRELVIAVYFLNGTAIWLAHAFTGDLTSGNFVRRRGKWAFTRKFGTPSDLLAQYSLVRMAFGTSARYPRTTTDRHGWKLRCESFEAHLAYVFAHELHHFRRHHLGYHSGEGEQGACRWGLERAKEAGYQVDGRRVKPLPKRRAKKVSAPAGKNPQLLKQLKLSASHLCFEDLQLLYIWAAQRIMDLKDQQSRQELEEHFEKLRQLPPGVKLKVLRNDVRPGRPGETVQKVRNLRRNSPRMQVRASDGKIWHWPMQWLEAM